MKNRPRPLTGNRTCHRILGGWNAFVRGPKPFVACEGQRVENDESFDFTALRITRLLVTTRNEISREEEFFPPDVIVFLAIRYLDFLHFVCAHSHVH